MFIDYTPEQYALRDEVRAYMATLMTDEMRAEVAVNEGGGPHYDAAIRKLGADGWLGLGFPKEFGGQNRGPIEQFILYDEMQRAGFPPPVLTLCTVGPALLEYGSDAQKAEYIPRVLAGECHFAVGYSEPQGGTDLASLKTRAVRDDDGYVINGQKIWTSTADYADYIWLAARTDPDAPKHKGISILIVPTDAPGVTISKIRTMGNNNTHATYYEDVRVPHSALVGRENGGWRVITQQLNHERVAINAVGPMARILAETRDWAAETRLADGSRAIDQPWVQRNLAEVEAKLDVLRLLNWQQAWHIAEGTLGPAQASAIKVYGSEMYVETSRLLLEVLGVEGALKGGSKGALLEGYLERFYRLTLVLTFGGGTNEIQRDMISMYGLGLPRGRMG